MKKIVCPILCMMLLTGCAGHGNVSDKAYLRAVSADGERITFSFYDEECGVISVTADDIETAKSSAELALGNEIFTGHTGLVILGDCDKADMLEYILHEWKVPSSCRTAEAESGEELLRTRNAEDLINVIDTAKKKGITDECDIVTVLGRLLNNEQANIPLFSNNGAVR